LLACWSTFIVQKRGQGVACVPCPGGLAMLMLVLVLLLVLSECSISQTMVASDGLVRVVLYAVWSGGDCAAKHMILFDWLSIN
jgi:hypothetical protein